MHVPALQPHQQRPALEQGYLPVCRLPLALSDWARSALQQPDRLAVRQLHLGLLVGAHAQAMGGPPPAQYPSLLAQITNMGTNCASPCPGRRSCGHFVQRDMARHAGYHVPIAMGMQHRRQ